MFSCIVIDDEPLALKALQYKLKDFPQIEVKRTFLPHEFSFEEIEHIKPHVIFLDIEMIEINGIDLAETIQKSFQNIHIVFITAHANYAIKAFELNSVDYLLKPVSNLRLKKTIHRLQSLIQENGPITQMQSECKIQCFKEFQLSINGQLLPFKTSKVQELLAYFTLHRGLPIQRDVLIETLWPEQDFKKAKTNLHTCVSFLRKSLADLGFPDAILFTNKSYLFALKGLSIDVEQFGQRLKEVVHSGYTDQHAMSECITLYKGHLFEMNYYEWARSYAINLQNDLNSMLIQALKNATLSQESALSYIRLLSSTLLFYEDETVLFLMEQYLHFNKRIEAVSLFKKYEQFLQQELKLQPSDTILSLYETIVETNSTPPIHQ